MSSADRLIDQNVVLVQLLGLCPLLAVSNRVSYAVGLSIATIAVLVLSNVSVSLVRRLISTDIRIPAFVVIIASIVTAVELLARAFAFQLYEALGIFLPLIVTNCAILARAEVYASKNPPLAAAADGFLTGLGFAVVITALAAVREFLGTGTILANLQVLIGDLGWSKGLELFEGGMLLALLPPGAFILLGCMVAGFQVFVAPRRTRRRVAVGTELA